MRVLVTGGAGFIGSHLVRRLALRGDDVHLLLRPQTSISRIADLADELHLHRLNLSEEPRLRALLAQLQPRQVYHLASETRLTANGGVEAAVLSVTEDLGGLMALLAALSSLGNPPEVFVRAGSIAEYGPIETPYRENQMTDPANAYGASCAAATIYLRMLQGRLPFPAITARLALVYGEGQSESFLVPALLRACLEDAPFHVARPSDRRDLISVHDVADALLHLGEAPPATARVLNIATGVAPSMREIAGALTGLTGADPRRISFGDDAPPGTESTLLASPALAREMTAWSATTAWREGLSDLVAGELSRSRRPFPAG